MKSTHTYMGQTRNRFVAQLLCSFWRWARQMFGHKPKRAVTVFLNLFGRECSFKSVF